jgi:SAM-dependent methyltransferase
VKYVCPDCKAELQDFGCAACGARFAVSGEIPNLLSRAPQFENAARISEVYDGIYEKHTNVWEDQGRPARFIRYFADLVNGLSRGPLLEVGCGEGILLHAFEAREKAAIDISAVALRKTRQLTGAECAVAIAERLPFPDACFDAVVSVGVMEHFLDDNAAISEIRRVLRPGGYSVTLVHTAMTPLQSARQKIREFVFPRPRPVALAQWLAKKLFRPIHQPVQLGYTLASSRACMERNGLMIERVISARDRHKPPLGGPHVVIFVARKPEDVSSQKPSYTAYTRVQASASSA